MSYVQIPCEHKQCRCGKYIKLQPDVSQPLARKQPRLDLTPLLQQCPHPDFFMRFVPSQICSYPNEETY